MPADPSPEALFLQAVERHRAGEFQQAEALYRGVLAADQGHVGALQGLAALAWQFGRHDVAAELFRGALALRPEIPELHDQLGQVLCAAGDPAAALPCFERALGLRPGFAAAAAHLARARGELALSLDPDYGDAGQVEGHGLLEEANDSTTVFVLFAGLGVGRQPPAFIFRNFLKAWTTIDKLFVRDLSFRWYLRGIPGHSTDVETTARFLDEKTRRYSRRVFIGSSAGATAAILYGELLRVDKVIAFAPQTLLGAGKAAALGDDRWERRLVALRDELGESRFLDLQNLAPLQTPVDLYYPEGVVLDRLHAERLRGPGVALQPQPGDSHLVALAMRDRGALRPLIERELPGARDEMQP